MQTIDKLLELEDGAAARTATGNGTGIACDLRKLVASICRLHVTAADSADGNETYVVALQVSNALAGTYTEVARVTITRGVTGIYEMAVTGEGVRKLVSDAAYARLAWTLGGTTPSLTFKGYLAPV